MTVVNSEGEAWSFSVWIALSLLSLLTYLGYLATSFVISYRRAAAKRSNLPSAPASFPFGSLRLLAKGDRVDSLRNIVENYGEDGVVFLQILNRPFAVVTRYDHVKQICNHAAHHAPRGVPDAYKDAGENVIMYWLGSESMLFKDSDNHDEWKFIRRLVSRSFLSVNIKKLRAPMSKIHAGGMDVLAGMVAKSGDTPIEMEAFLFSLTMDVLGESSFSQDFGGFKTFDGGEEHKIVKAFGTLCGHSETRNFRYTATRPWLKPKYLWIPTASNREFVRSANTIRDHVNEIITTRQALIKSNKDVEFSDFLQTMLDASDDDTGRRFTRAQLVDNLVTIMFAGYDTTALTLTYILYRIAKHPEVQQRVFEEVERVLPNGARPTDDTYRQLEYLHLVFKETLRMHSPVFLTIRAVQEDLKVDKYLFKKGTICFIPMYAAMHDEMNYTNAMEFRPERHLEEEAQSRFHAFMPFMKGQRTCIGQRFAELSAVMSLAVLVQRFEFKLPDDYVMETKVVAPMQRPKTPLRLIVTERKR